jgi:hypothetical protein
MVVMTNVFEVANALVSHVRQAYPQDVAMVAYYGSHATGAASDRSDLDLYFIPDNGNARSLYRSFIVDGRAFEFWPVSWEFAEKIAAGKHHWAVAPSIIANARVLYSRSEADLARFEALKTKIADLQKPENKGELLARAWETYITAPFYLETLRLACARRDILGARRTGCQLVNAVLDCLALVNQTFLARDWTSDIEPVRNLIRKPEQTLELIEVVTTSGDAVRIRCAAEDLLRRTREILVCEQRENKNSSSIQEDLDGYYAAIHEYTAKIISACEQRNLVKVGYWTSLMQSETALMLAQANGHADLSEVNLYSEYGAYMGSLGWPDMVQAMETGDFGCIADQARGFAHKAGDYLSAHSVPLHVYGTLAEAQSYIRGTGE